MLAALQDIVVKFDNIFSVSVVNEENPLVEAETPLTESINYLQY
jgi:hypothetical protein